MANKSKPVAGTMADQLKPVAAGLRQKQSAIRPVSQVILALGKDQSGTAFDTTRKACVRWMADRAGRAIPAAAWEGGSFELEEVGAQRVGAVGIESPRYWAARLDDADKKVPQRTWVTEIGLGQAPDGTILFGVRLVSVTRGEDVPFDRSIPGFVRPIIESVGARLDGRLVQPQPWIVATETDVKQLVALLQDPARDADVIVIALPESSTDQNEAAVPVLDIHRRTLGAAHVVVLTGPASFDLSDRVGKEFSVFRQAVRTYLPGFNPDQDEPFRHPLALPARIEQWPDGGAAAYSRMLISQSLARSVARPDREQRLPSYATIRQLAAKHELDQARKAGSSDSDLLKLAWDEIAQLRKSMEEEKKNSDDLLASADQERDTAIQSAQQTKARADALLRRVEALEARLEEVGEKPHDVPIPADLEDFPSWCEKYLSGMVEVHNRAHQGVKKSQYQDDEFLYRALLLLRNYYVPMRRVGGADLKQAYDAECFRLGLEESGTISGERLGEQGETYFVNFAGKRCVLDRHLKKGASKDQRICFRLYFFWDEDSEQAVVGWMPSHLDTRQT